MIEYRFEDNARLSGELAADGMVLLENRDRALPFENGVKVAVFGHGQLNFSMGGTGSAAVFTAYKIGAIDGLIEQENAGRIKLDREVLDAYRADPEFEESAEFVDAAAKRNDAALLIISRNAGEGTDRRDVPGDYRLSEYEVRVLKLLTDSAFSRIVVVVNSGGLIDLAFFHGFDKLKSLLLCWQPGMQGGRALARVLCGEVNPSGRLADTIAKSYDDYPTSRIFQKYHYQMDYEEDIFVGYRYFETLPGAKERVLYPFGFGLSYTTFSVRPTGFSCDGGRVKACVEVANTGNRAGRIVVQLYSGSPATGKLEYPALELRDFAKSKLLAPGETQALELSVAVDDLASFDDTGISGAPEGSFVLEAGEFRFSVGTDVRTLTPVGSFSQPALRVLASPGLLLQRGLARRMHADGTFTTHNIAPACGNMPLGEEEPAVFTPKIMLEDVTSGKHTMEEFLSQLTRKELYHLTHGQPSLFPSGTGGFGNLRRYGIPNPQTADGPAGLRKAVPTTCFPCATLVACSWDRELQYRMGEALAHEGLDSDVDILLAPGLNIHRDVLCGRNFEYFSEDPLVTGRTAAQLVRGEQEHGLGSTLKHFAVNSRENYRKLTDSVVSERALREIYLRGFEIAVRTAHPWCVMSSYNIVNGEKASCSYNLLVKILREEWGFDGLVMTDWGNLGPYWKELINGSDLKMPGINVFEHKTAELVHQIYKVISRKVLERGAANVLNVVMRTRRFRERDFGQVNEIAGNGKAFRLKAAEMTTVLNDRSKLADCSDADGGICHCHLITVDNTPQELVFSLNVGRAGVWRAAFRLATCTPNNTIEVWVDDRKMGGFTIEPTQPRRSPDEERRDISGKELQSWQTQGDIRVELPAGGCELKIVIDTPEALASGVSLNYIDFTPTG